MPFRLCLTFSALILICTVAPATAQTRCGWMSAQTLDSLLPAAAPWRVMVGGSMGSCKFTGSGGPGGVAILGANQMLKSDAAEAAELARSLRNNLGADYRIEADSALGEHGFLYFPKSAGGAESRVSVSYVGHYKHVAITGQLVMPVGAGFDAYRSGAKEFMRAALAVADDAKATAEAAHCRWFDEPILRRLLPGEGFSQQAFGANSCMAQNGSAMALILSIQDGVGEDVAARMRDASCTWEAVEAGAMLGHSCSSGRPRAILQIRHQGKLLQYALAPSREPTPEERALLVELGVKVSER
ncbi:hypothetical protein [Pseudomarimonas arenosa]|uniref:DUF1028 domain-containing protein n=1 Tax=Pseudomarimonas arenosa TaxID=2774145 RepID=A0AAW3ZQS9_9GAMM|nr:hypothetical protein [Pseudomarimonas arenosa]MBD8527900.1 hypothetical protein [Pseudomarimonas arenosa]